MRGDFSAWNKDRSRNFRGTLHQQGRVLTDRDWNAQTEVIGEWQETAGRDTFGSGVAAVPAEVPESFKVLEAKNVAASGTTPAHVEISLKKGRVWADGLLAELFPDVPPPLPADWPGADAVRTATYLGPPIQAAPLPGAVPAVADRDAVVLETWLEELSAFQVPDLLIEPALGGVDTTERVRTAYRMRLFRMDDGENCSSIISKLSDDFASKGKLTVKPDAAATLDGDCPVEVAGGYTGFEHRLYRIEIAETTKPGRWFKWSQMNGGLVGRGVFRAAGGGGGKVDVTANKNAISYSGLNSFYLEALAYDPKEGCWRVIYGINDVTLNSDHTLTLPAAAANIFVGSIPPEKSGTQDINHFFRLWNGIEDVSGYVAAEKNIPDNNGLKMKFDTGDAAKYSPGDYWTFEARAGEIGNPPIIVDDRPPQGILYHRVPLAEINWTSNDVSGDDIEDCRLVFQPLTKQKTCCTYRVGDGVHSHGDFIKIQDAIDALPKSGGEVCILPGVFEENIVLEAPHNRNIILKGCGIRTLIRAANNDKVIPADDPKFNAVIYVKNGQGIEIDSLAVEAHKEGVGIYLEGAEKDAADKNLEKYLKNIKLTGLWVSAVMRSAIKGHVAQFLTLSNSVIRIHEADQTRHPAVYLAGDDMLIERNEIRVLPARLVPPTVAGAPSLFVPPVGVETDDTAATNDPSVLAKFPAQEAAGGLQIGGGSERVRILNNLIVNGTGNGITLGSIDLMKDGIVTTSHDPFHPKDQPEDCCNPDDGFEDDGETDENGYTAVAGPPLYDILIKFNRIFNMGRNGIGVATFFSLGEEPDIANVKIGDFVAVGGMIFVSHLVIVENRIERCVNIKPRDIPSKMSYLMGYGGIALAVVDTLIIRDNFIVDNCRDCRDPVCGIYALAVIGLDISRNELTEHLPQDYREVKSDSVKQGPRGGIWVFISIGQVDLFGGGRFEKAASDALRDSTGAHAARIHENVVSVPLGRCLTTMTLGDASVLGNRFTTYGLVPVDIIKLFMALIAGKGKLNVSAILQLFSLLAGNVMIFDLGTFLAVKEYQRVFASGTKTSSVAAPAAGGNINSGSSASANHISDAYAGFDAISRLMNLFTASGMIHFSDNQCKLNPRIPDLTIAYCSIFIAGLADDGFHDNQSSCSIPRSLMVTNASLLGGTVRATGNWLKETFLHVGFSGITYGFLNATTDNESVHCLRVNGIQRLDRHNLVLAAAFSVTGDVATDENHNKLKEFCSKNSAGRIFAQMYLAILRDQGTANTTAGLNQFIRPNG